MTPTICCPKTLIASLLTVCLSIESSAHDFFTIQIVDDQTGRGVPLVELRTVNNVCHYTDSAGIIAFNEPGLMNQSVFFHIASHGYEYPKDGFGFRGEQLTVTPGGNATLKIKRVNIAQRLYRVTGAGIYRDSVLTGQAVPINQPVLNGRVLGSDSVVNAVYNGKIHWFWGDTNRPSYPLGNFHVPGAVSRLPDDGGIDPEVGVDLEYFLDAKGFAKPMAKMPGSGPTWINALVTLADKSARDQMYASYVKVDPPLSVYERGLAKLNDKTNRFEKLVTFDLKSPLFPQGHPLVHPQQGTEYVYFCNPFPMVRVRASADALGDLKQYEAYTCLKRGSGANSTEVERRAGAPAFDWKADTAPYTPKLQARLIKQGLIRSAEGLFQLRDQDGNPAVMHRGSVYWNDYRNRWVMIAVQQGGTSMLGEVWYAESNDLVGPWVNGRKIVSHRRYSFYNPKQHPMFDKSGGRVIFFEGTYTSMFSGNDSPTPRYDYNQIMYKLDLSDPRLHLPDETSGS